MNKDLELKLNEFALKPTFECFYNSEFLKEEQKKFNRVWGTSVLGTIVIDGIIYSTTDIGILIAAGLLIPGLVGAYFASKAIVKKPSEDLFQTPDIPYQDVMLNFGDNLDEKISEISLLLKKEDTSTIYEIFGSLKETSKTDNSSISTLPGLEEKIKEIASAHEDVLSTFLQGATRELTYRSPEVSELKKEIINVLEQKKEKVLELIENKAPAIDIVKKAIRFSSLSWGGGFYPEDLHKKTISYLSSCFMTVKELKTLVDILKDYTDYKLYEMILEEDIVRKVILNYLNISKDKLYNKSSVKDYISLLEDVKTLRELFNKFEESQEFKEELDVSKFIDSILKTIAKEKVEITPFEVLDLTKSISYVLSNPETVELYSNYIIDIGVKSIKSKEDLEKVHSKILIEWDKWAKKENLSGAFWFIVLSNVIMEEKIDVSTKDINNWINFNLGYTVYIPDSLFEVLFTKEKFDDLDRTKILNLMFKSFDDGLNDRCAEVYINERATTAAYNQFMKSSFGKVASSLNISYVLGSSKLLDAGFDLKEELNQLINDNWNDAFILNELLSNNPNISTLFKRTLGDETVRNIKTQISTLETQQALKEEAEKQTQALQKQAEYERQRAEYARIGAQEAAQANQYAQSAYSNSQQAIKDANRNRRSSYSSDWDSLTSLK